ncbi:MAG: hypothetical protein AB8B55_05055 [Mariniblastus sp.]
MKNRIQNRTHAICLLFSFFAITAITSTTQLHADDFQISLHRGSVVTVDVGDEIINWTTVLKSGEMSKKEIPFANIQRMILSDAPASQQVAEIRGLLNMLESPDYLQRITAEEELSRPQIGGRFLSLVKAQKEHPKYEVRYRIERILDRLDTDTDEAANEFDIITLKDGTQLEGDAGTFELSCKYRDQTFSFARSDIRLIAEPVAPVRATKVASEVKVEMFYSHEDGFYKPDQVLVDFNQSPAGVKLKKDHDVAETFVPMGLKIGTEDEGFVGISGYPFRFNLPPSGDTICVFKTGGSYRTRFKGVMEFQFCMPNQKSVPAGVHEIGMFMARVNKSRDFLLEAYNADGQILAAVESTDKRCVFGGVKSTELITKIRIISNPYLFRIDRTIDEDFAVDHVCFSPPVPVANPKVTPPESPEKKDALKSLSVKTDKDAEKELAKKELPQSVVRLLNGDSIRGTKLEIIGEDSVSIHMTETTPIEIKLAEIQSLQFATKESMPKENKWLVVLKDRSMLYATPGEKFVSEKFDHLSFAPNEVAAISASKNRVRFPEASDFTKGKSVLVFPTCRVPVEMLTFTDSGYSWNKKATKIQQPVNSAEAPDEEDPTPQFYEVDYAETAPFTVPTVWTNKPISQEPGTGQLRLLDGQQLTLGGSAGFEVTNFSPNSITISASGKTVKIPIEEILSVEFATKD